MHFTIDVLMYCRTDHGFIRAYLRIYRSKSYKPHETNQSATTRSGARDVRLSIPRGSSAGSLSLPGAGPLVASSLHLDHKLRVENALHVPLKADLVRDAQGLVRRFDQGKLEALGLALLHGEYLQVADLGKVHT